MKPEKIPCDCGCVQIEGTSGHLCFLTVFGGGQERDYEAKRERDFAITERYQKRVKLNTNGQNT